MVNIPKKKSFFLFGARGTGKSTLMRELFPDSKCLYIDLLLPKEEDYYSRSPDELVSVIAGMGDEKPYVVIDEIQKVPRLLDVVHHLIETTSKYFVLTGSSARKIKAGGANLLAGRAFQRYLFPLTHVELGGAFDSEQALRWGTLPGVMAAESDGAKADFLIAYTQTYLKEEVWGEQFIRKLDPFRKFLEVAAQCNGKIINFSNIARDTGVDSKTVKSYYEILEDTLLGFFLESYSPSTRKSVYRSPKFYFFDTGVSRALSRYLDIPPKPSTSYYGELFEHLVIAEAHRLLHYSRKQYRMYYLRTQGNSEVDLIVDRPGQPHAVIEIKSGDEITETKLASLARFKDEFPDGEFFCFSRDPRQKRYDAGRAIHWREGLAEIFLG